jgi:predicted O-methyltransferase YrrM
MDFIDSKILEYAELHSGNEPEILSELSRETQARILYPRMLSGHLQGRLLAAISRMIRPGNILEIGTYTGYSAICLAEGLGNTGKLITIDANDELHEMATRYFKKAGLQDKIELMNGDAAEIIPKLDLMFDLIFIDADKINYPKYLLQVMNKLNSGGWILADNVLWSGNVLQPESERDPETRAITEFNETVKSNSGLFKVLIPVRDGLFLMQKI